ncbi:hypothetical protein [Tolypothrix sp. VBCCA 56010]|uniref:hypothetical protein n=1 Tax=Tolypothrix sp. VBCCA 56010 TaxID=3137731 RepID=UPI003D7C8178
MKKTLQARSLGLYKQSLRRQANMILVRAGGLGTRNATLCAGVGDKIGMLQSGLLD